MMLKEERHTPKAISFRIEIPDIQGSKGNMAAEPPVKKRLELSAQKAAQGPQITIAEINNKLLRAEEKRKKSLTQQISPKVEERRLNAWENKKYMEKQQLEHYKDKFEKVLPQADEKRRTTRENKRQKLRQHIAHVENIRKEQATKRKESSESLNSELQKKHENAEQLHQQELEQKVKNAQHSAEKKKSTTNISDNTMKQGQAYDEIPLPQRNPNFRYEYD